MSTVSKLNAKRPGRPVGSDKRVAIRNRAIRFLEKTLKNENADDQARVMAANKLLELNPEVQT